MTRMVRCLSAGASLAVMLCASGCGWLPVNWMGGENGRLLYGFDELAAPGQTVTLAARLQEGTFLRDQERRAIRFSLAGELLGEATTDDEGIARIRFTPREVRDYRIVVEALPKREDDATRESSTLLVACREPGAPIAVVDLDKTLVASGFWDVLSKDADGPVPMPGSQRVMRRLADAYFVVYLTHRTDHLGPKTKRWLADNGYPEAPLLMSRFRGLIEGSRSFKTQALEEVHGTFTNLRLGIGDRISDAQAYRANGMRAILIFHLHEGDDPSDVARQADELERLPRDVDVVADWTGIEKAVFKDVRYPAVLTVQCLRRRIEALREGRAP